jgi:hypothetical protein
VKGVRPPAAGKGRPKGVPNKATARREAMIAAGGETPLDYLLSVMRNDSATVAERTDAAKAAAPYVHPRLSSIELGNKDGSPFRTISEIALVPVEPKRDQ